MSEAYFGPEIVERPIGSAIVTELKAATLFLVGTALINEVHEGDEVNKYINQIHLVRTRKDAAKLFGKAKAGTTIPQALDAIFDQALNKGIGTIAVVNVFDPNKHASLSDVTNLDIIGGFDNTGKASGLSLAYSCFQKFGWFPKILLATGFSGLTGVRTELEVIANKLRSRAIIDAPIGVSPQQVVEARGPEGLFDLQTNSRRTIIAWPNVKVLDKETGDIIIEPYSARLAGVMLRSIIEYGYQHSPSNRAIFGIEDMAQDVLYIPGDRGSDSQLLRGAGIVTTEERWGKGPHTSGNRSAAYPTDTDMRNFIHVQYTEDMLDEAILFYLDQYKDRNGGSAQIEFIEDRINSYLRSKTSGDNPCIYDGCFYFDREKTTADNVVNGHFHWKLEYAPIGIMERLTVERGIDINMIRDALQLSQS